MSREYRWYRGWFPVFLVVMTIRFRFRVSGRENIPKGAAMVCANHTSNLDPMLLIQAFGRDNHLHCMAKEKLFKIPLLGRFLRCIGTISVNRNLNDIAAVRAAMGYLKDGEKVGIFPEGRRVSDDESVAAKTGAVRLADRTNSPIVPVFIPRDKPLFRRVTVIIGEPYYVNPGKAKLTPEDTARLSSELMDKIRALGDGA
jgi:1-acyl-sn-glycerol-3-phosphate acyltransferase